MKFIALVSCVLVAAFIGQTHGRPDKKPCDSNDLGDYKGGCDISVPVIVMPKGRPIMERVLDWFNCGTELCHPTEPAPTTSTKPDEGTTGTSITTTATGTMTTSPNFPEAEPETPSIYPTTTGPYRPSLN